MSGFVSIRTSALAVKSAASDVANFKESASETFGDTHGHRMLNADPLVEQLVLERRLYWANDDQAPTRAPGDPMTIIPRVPAPFITDTVDMARRLAGYSQSGEPGPLTNSVSTPRNPLHFNINNPIDRMGLVDEQVVKLGTEMLYSGDFHQ